MRNILKMLKMLKTTIRQLLPMTHKQISNTRGLSRCLDFETSTLAARVFSTHTKLFLLCVRHILGIFSLWQTIFFQKQQQHFHFISLQQKLKENK